MLSASEHPALSEGTRTVLSGLNIFAVSAINSTPQNTIISLSVSAALRLNYSESDLGMIKLAGTGVAMGNASEIVKVSADHIVGDNDNDGVSEAIEKFIKKGVI